MTFPRVYSGTTTGAATESGAAAANTVATEAAGVGVMGQDSAAHTTDAYFLGSPFATKAVTSLPFLSVSNSGEVSARMPDFISRRVLDNDIFTFPKLVDWAGENAMFPRLFRDLMLLPGLSMSDELSIELINLASTPGAEGEAARKFLVRYGRDLPIFKEIVNASTNLMLPDLETSFTPPARTPWGGTEIRPFMSETGIDAEGQVGEAWVVSGHPKFPNMITVNLNGAEVKVPLWLLGEIYPLTIYGAENVENHGANTPFLTKLLNSGSWAEAKANLRPLLATLDGEGFETVKSDLGIDSFTDILAFNNHSLHLALSFIEDSAGSDTVSSIGQIHQEMVQANLSVQIHPTAEYAEANPSKGWHSKTEMWVVLGAEKGAGFYLGLKEGVTPEEVDVALRAGEDISDYLNFVEVKPGEVYFIPSGTPHAIGAGVLLLEQQETSETTFRYFDWGRTDADGNPRELHVDDAIAVTNWDAPRGDDFVDSVRRTPHRISGGVDGYALHELLAKENEFSYDRLTFKPNDVFLGDSSGGMQGLTVTQGAVDIVVTKSDGSQSVRRVVKGQSVVVPASVKSYKLVASSDFEKTEIYMGRSDSRNVYPIDQLMQDSGVGFGTSGARGTVEGLTDRVAYAYTVGFIQYMEGQGIVQPGDRIAVAGDLRPSSPRIMEAVSRAIADTGYIPVNTGFIPSPAVAHYGIEEGIAAVMVTGSHIPADRNGIKYNLPDGEILKKDEAGIKSQAVTLPEDIFDEDGMFVSTAQMGMPEVEAIAGQSYVDRYVNFFGEGALAGMNIGLYQHSAVGRDMFRELLTRLGADVTVLNRSDVFIPVDTEAIRPEDLILAGQWVEQYGFDAIVSTDGDTDRPLIAGPSGEWLRGDVLGIIVAQYLNADSVTTPVSSNTAVDGLFQDVRRTRIGSPFVIQGMMDAAEGGAQTVVSYEANGGFLTFTDIERDGRTLSPLPTRSAFLPIVAALHSANTSGQTIDDLVAGLPQRFTVSDRIKDFPQENSRAILAMFNTGDEAQDIAVVEGKFGEAFGKVSSIDRTDGVRITFESGEIVHLRPSGNAPEFRVYTEADSQKRSEEINKQAMLILKEIAGLD